MAVQIYVFFYIEGEAKRFFYVGRSKDLNRRMREHNRSKRKGHEDKYERIRQLETAGIEWDSEPIETVTDDDYFPDAERWHVIRLTREGHELMNMRHGSIEHRKELVDQISSRHIRCASDVRADRSQRQHHKLQASKKQRRKVWTRELKACGLPDIAGNRAIPAVFRRKILALAAIGGFSNASYGKGFTLAEFVRSIRRPLSKEREFQKFVEKIRHIPLPSRAA